MDTLSLSGYFWLPDHSNAKIAGLLDFSPESGGTLQPIGSFTSIHDLFEGTVRDTKRIVGSDIGGQHFYTLDNCLQTRLGNSQTFHVGTVIDGYHFERTEAIACDEIGLSLTYLQPWLNLTSIAYEMGLQEAKQVGHMKIGVRSVPDMTTSFPKGDLTIKHIMSMSHRIARGELSERFEVRLAFADTLPYADAVDYASDLQDLLSIATHRVSAFEKITIKHPDAHERGGNPPDESARLWSQWLAQARPSKHTLTDQDMTFTFEQLGGIDGVGTWMTAAQTYRSELGRVMNTRYREGMFQEDVHLARTAAVESFHKRRWPKTKPDKGKKNVTLAQRLTQLMDHGGDAFDALVAKDKQAVWRKRVVDERNDVAHHLGRNLHQDTVELFYFSDSVYWLFVICMLREARAPAACFEQLVQHRAFTRCARALDGLL